MIRKKAMKQIKNYIHSTAADFQPVCKFFIFGRRQRPVPERFGPSGDAAAVHRIRKTEGGIGIVIKGRFSRSLQRHNIQFS
jgi:hypothetical protein